MGEIEVYAAKLAAESGQIPDRYIFNEEERFGQSEDGEFPVISLYGSREDIVKALTDACHQWGFFQVIDHDVPTETIGNAMEVGREFFDLPLEEKKTINSLGMNTSSDPYGAYKYGRYIKPKRIDWKDVMRMDYCLANKLDVWPEKPPTFGKIMKDYNERVRKLAEDILEMMSEGLGLKSKTHLKTLCTQTQIMRMNYFPPCHSPELVKGQSAHTDVRAMTILLQDGVGGLEVSKDGKWYSVKPIPNAFVVNVADTLQILSNGKYKSALHRVRVNSEKSRMSIPVFFGPIDSDEIGPLPEVVNETTPALYRTCTSGEFIRNFYKVGPGSSDVLDFVKL